MHLPSIWVRRERRAGLRIAPVTTAPQLPIVSSSTPQPKTGAQAAESGFWQRTWFLATQAAWIEDPHPLKIWEKSRQVGATKTDAFDSVLKVSPAGARFDVWFSSRDELQSMLYLEDCKEWAKILNLAATDLG